MNNLISQIDILEESKENFLTYAEEVLTDRAIPSAEDGLLSVHRKLIWTMEEVLKMTNKSKYKKSASIVGTTLATSYFHGDTACYGALCKIAQPYLMRYPLIDGDGNLGTQEGNGMEAAARYTNARPSKYADLMMNNFKKNVVPLKETYNNEYMEPVVLPSLLPNAIVNGRESIGISMAHNSLPHNLSEVCDAIIARLEKNKSLTIDELMKYIKGPDFPLENTVINSKDIKTAYATGHSSVSLKVRGKYRIEKNKIIFDTIPYRSYRNKIKEQINKNIDVLSEYIEDFSDESNVGVNKLVFDVKKGKDPEQVVLKLFALTNLQNTLSYNMNYIVNGTPKLCSMMDLVDAYVEHQIDVLLKATEFDKAKAEKRKHILEGLILIIKSIDKAIELIRSSMDKAEAAQKLIKEFKIDEEQAKAVLDMKLSRLTKLDKDDLLKELEEKKKIIAECNKIINDELYRNKTLINLVSALKETYGDKRRTELLNIEVPKEDKEIETVIPKDVVVVTTKTGLIKKIPVSNFSVQRRGGRGLKSTEGIIISTIKTNTIDYMIFFTDKGKMYRTIVDNIPDGTNASMGSSINNIIKLEPDEKVIAVTSLHRKVKKLPQFVFFFTKQGMVKKTYLSEYFKTKKNAGIAALKLKEGDSVAKILFQDNEDIVVVTKDGMGIKFGTKEVGAIGRVAVGVKAINLKEGDEVVSALPVHKETDTVGLFTSNGLGKKIDLKEIPIQKRGGKGVLCSKLDKYVTIVGAEMLSDEDKLLITGDKSSIYITAKDVPLYGRTSQGNILIKNNNMVQSIAKI